MQSNNKYRFPEWVKILLLAAVILLSALLSRCGIMENVDLRVWGTKDAKTATMQELFQTALEPMGSTMYIWGGGWDSKNERSGKSATQIGISAKWAEFASMQDSDYDFEEHRYESENGLDCSGYVGWIMYNLFEEKDGRQGYVTFSTSMAEDFASRGWGNLIINPHEFLPGDVVSMEGHVWICLGTCEDGSVLLAHSSPPGVSVCGTVVPGEKDTSIAAELAEKFMMKNYPKWQEKYPKRLVSESYLENVVVLRWNEKTLQDAKEFQALSGEEIIAMLCSM